MAVVTPTAKAQFIDAAGIPLAGGFLYTYAAGTTTPQATYTDSAASTANSNPIVLDSRGEANIWLGSATYKFKLCDSTNTEIWTVDNISAPTSALSPVLSGNVTISSSSSGSALSITQSGTGPVLKVVDPINPSSTLFIVDNSGHIGIGTASPASEIDVLNGAIQVSSAGGTARSKVYADATNSYYTAEGTRTAVITANSTNLIYADSSGYVGIKNATPTAELDVTGAIKTSGNITGGAAISSTTTLTAGSSLNVTTSATVGTTLSVDTVQEKTAAAGVSIPSTLKVDTISGKTSANTITIGGVSIVSSQVDPANRVITSSSVQSTTSGTAVTFGSIPSWVRRISVHFNSVSLSGTDNLQIELGTSGGFGGTTYAASGIAYPSGSTPTALSSTAGLLIYGGFSNYFYTGTYIIDLMDSTNRIYVGTGNLTVLTTTFISAVGLATLNGTLTQLKILPSGSNTFDFGSVNIFYE